jgi:hypothetical protein
MISFGSAPLGPGIYQYDIQIVPGKEYAYACVPVSAEVVRTVGRLKRFAKAEWAKILFLNSTGL